MLNAEVDQSIQAANSHFNAWKMFNTLPWTRQLGNEKPLTTDQAC